MAYENIIIFVIIIIAIIIPIKIVLDNNKKKQINSYYSKSNTKRKDPDMVKQEQNEKGLDLLKERLVSGKITKEEYDDLKKEFE